jgi:hypothetical protein
MLMRSDAAAYERMLTLIRAGAFAWVAAQSLGIAAETFSRWMARGARQRRGIFRQFRQDVEQAQALARITAEIQVRRENPLAWLRSGPARSRPGMPGWTDLPGCDSGEAEMVHEPTPVQLPDVRNQINPLAAVLPVLEEIGLITLTAAGREMLTIGTSGESANYVDNGQAAPE